MSGTSILFSYHFESFITLLASSHSDFRNFIERHSSEEKIQNYIYWPQIGERFTSELCSWDDYENIKNDNIFKALIMVQLPHTISSGGLVEYVTPKSNTRPPVYLHTKYQQAVSNTFSTRQDAIPEFWLDKIVEISTNYDEASRKEAIEFIKNKNRFYCKEHQSNEAVTLLYTYLTQADEEVSANELVEYFNSNELTVPMLAFVSGYMDKFLNYSGNDLDVKQKYKSINANLKSLQEQLISNCECIRQVVGDRKEDAVLSNSLLIGISKKNTALLCDYIEIVIDNADLLTKEDSQLIANTCFAIASQKELYEDPKMALFVHSIADKEKFLTDASDELVKMSRDRVKDLNTSSLSKTMLGVNC